MADACGLVGNSMTIDDAIARATRAHEGQTDKAGKPYIDHLLRVMNGVRIESELDAAAKMAAVLHDVLEDTTVTSADLRSLGCPSEVIEAVEAVTKRDEEDLEAYLSRVAANRVAYAVKWADRFASAMEMAGRRPRGRRGFLARETEPHDRRAVEPRLDLRRGRADRHGPRPVFLRRMGRCGLRTGSARPGREGGP
jgi:(p)ppGpp synthase/HD superfamily hydrolase